MPRLMRFLFSTLAVVSGAVLPLSAAGAQPAFTAASSVRTDGSGVTDIFVTWQDQNARSARSYTVTLLNPDGTLSLTDTMPIGATSYDFPRVPSAQNPYSLFVFGTYDDGSVSGSRLVVNVPSTPENLPPVVVDPSAVDVTATDGGWQVSWTEEPTSASGGYYLANSDQGSCLAAAVTPQATASCLIEGDATGDAPSVDVTYYGQQPAPPPSNPSIPAVDPATVDVVASDGGWLVSWTEPDGVQPSWSYLATSGFATCQADVSSSGARASCLLAGDASGDAPSVSVQLSSAVPIDVPPTILVNPADVTVAATDSGWLVNWTEPDLSALGVTYLAKFGEQSCEAPAVGPGDTASCVITGDSSGPAPSVFVTYTQPLAPLQPVVDPTIEVDPATVTVVASEGGWLVSWIEPHGVVGGRSYFVDSPAGSCEAAAVAEGNTASCLIASDNSGDAPQVTVSYDWVIRYFPGHGQPWPVTTSTIPGPPDFIAEAAGSSLADRFFHDAHNFKKTLEAPTLTVQPVAQNGVSTPFLVAGILILIGGASLVMIRVRNRKPGVK